MLESYVIGLVDKYISPFAEIDADDVRAGVRKGEVCLRDVKLRTTAFDDLEMPLTVTGGTVGELRVQMGLKCLRAAPSSIIIRDVEIVIGPAGNLASASVRSDRRKATVAHLLREDEEARRVRVHGAQPMQHKEKSFFYKLLGSSIDSLTVKVENVHVRYEDGTSDASRPFAAGVTLDSLEFTTADIKSWRAANWVANSSVFNKLLSLSNMAVYWQKGTDNKYKHSPGASPPDSAAFYVLSPLSLSAMFSINRGTLTPECPRLGVKLTVQEVKYTVDCSTLQDVVCLLDAAVRHENRDHVAVDRPCVPYTGAGGAARVWWGYAIACAREEVRSRLSSRRPPSVSASIKRATRYVPLFKKMLLSGGGPAALPEGELSELRSLEGEMTQSAIMALRGRVEETLLEAPVAKPEAGAGLFARLLRGWGAREGGKSEVEVAGVVFSATEGEICELIGEEGGEGRFDDLLGDPEELPQYSVSASIERFEVCVSDRCGDTGDPGLLATATLIGMSCSTRGCRGPSLAFSGEAVLESMEAMEHQRNRPLILGGSSASPLLRVQASQGPPGGGGAAYTLGVQLEPATVTYSKALADRVAKMATFWRRVDGVALTALVSRSAAAQVDQQRLAALQLARHLFDTRDPVALSLSLALPDVIFCGAGSLVVARGGHLSATSTVAPAKASKRDVDRCEFVWRDIGALACAEGEDWRSAAAFSGASCVLHVPSVTVITDVAAARGEMGVVQLAVVQTVPHVHARATSHSLRHATRAMLECRGDSEGGASGDVALDWGQLTTMVGMAISFASAAEQGWEYMQRREMASHRAEAGLRAYADWVRATYSLTVAETTFSMSETLPGGGERPLVSCVVRGSVCMAVVRSLDATGSVTVGSVEILDSVQSHGDDYRYLLSGGGGGVGAVCTAKAMVWHRLSPDLSGNDVSLSFETGDLCMRINLETLADVQTVVATAVELGCDGFEAQAPPAPTPDRLGVLRNNVEGAASAVKQQYRRRPFGIHIHGVSESVSVLMYTSRGGAAYPIARAATGMCTFTGSESRRGRVESSGSLKSVSLIDLTPKGGELLTFPDGGLVASFTYVYVPQPEQGTVEVKLATTECTISPRFVAELYAFVCESSVYRTNLAAARRAAAGAQYSRFAFDAAALSQKHSVVVCVQAGGLVARMPAGDEGGAFTVSLPSFEVKNVFDGAVERIALNLAITVAANLVAGQPEEKLARVSMKLESVRQLSATAASGADTPVLAVSLELGTVEVSLGQAHVNLVWLAAISAASALRISLTTSSSLRSTDKSLLDIAVIRKGVESALTEMAVTERARLASGMRTAQRLLDLHVQASLEKLTCTLLGPKGTPIATVGVAGVSAGMWARSDTSWSSECRIFSLTLDDADPNTDNVHKALLRSVDPFAEIASMVYKEDAQGDGCLSVNFTGVRMVLSADPIFTIASQILSAFTAVALPPSAGGAAEEAAWGDDDSLFWSGGGTSSGKFEGKFAVGQCEVLFLQECKLLDTPRISFVFCSSGYYSSAPGAGGSGQFKLDDVEIKAYMPEFREPLNILERSSTTAQVKAQADGRRIDVDAVCSALDLVVTYQDVKLIYNIAAACQRSSERAGIMKTAGVQQIESLIAAALEEDNHRVLAPPPARWPSYCGITRSTFRVDLVSVCLINDCMGWTVPFATVSIIDINMALEARSDLSSSLEASASVECMLYNVINACFEPVLEPWTCSASRSFEAGGRGVRTKVKSEQVFDVIVSEQHMRGLVQTLESWVQDSKTWGAEAKPANTSERFWPYRLRNEAGTPFTFWLGSSLSPPDDGEEHGQGDAQAVRELASGGEQPFQFPRTRNAQARQRDMSLEFHTLSIKFEGIGDVLTHVPVDITGVHMLPLGDYRAVAEIHSDSGTKIVAIQSTLKVYNKTNIAVEASVSLEEEGPEAWSDTFAGDMHGCVPLCLVNCKYMRLRPTGGYQPSAPIQIPNAPVTGESKFICCLPDDTSDGGPKYFRIRLDAKKPIGGHEERMRVVISIHPAFRLQNFLPYPMQIGVHVGGRLLASIMPPEGALEQLHCSDLSQPLSMSTFLSHFRKGKEVLVYQPDAMTSTAKTVSLFDEAGLPLHIGIETTHNAWGDLTVVFYAQYLVLNFSQLPMRYGVFGGATRVVKECAGQCTTPTPVSSPVKSSAADAPEEEHASSTLKAIYAVFGPRSTFAGKLVECVPLMADTEVQNPGALQGCVAVIARGVVPFTVKARRAAAAGAVGVLFVNTDDTLFIAEGDSGPGIRLPCVMMSQTDGTRLLDEVRGVDAASAPRIVVAPETHNTRQRASSMQLEWKRVVHATVGVYGEMSQHLATPGTPVIPGKGCEFPDSWMEQHCDPPFMLSYDSIDLTGNRLAMRVRDSEWSAPFSLESMGTTGVLEAKGLPSSNPSLKKARPCYELGLSFQLGTGHFTRSKTVTIVPRYTVVNRTGFTLQLTQSELKGEPSAHLELPDDDLQPFHWMDEKKARTVMLRIVPRIGTQQTFHTGWGGPIKPEQVGTFALLLPPEHPGGEELHLTVEIRLRKAASFIIFRKADPARPMYRVTNTSSKRVVVWQEGGSALHNGLVVPQGGSLPYSWDRPNDTRVLMLGVEGAAPKQVQPVRFDEFGKFACLGGGGLLGEVLAEGGTRTLRVYDEPRKGILEDQSSNASDAPQHVVSSFVWEFSGAGVSLVDSKLEELMYLSVLDVSVAFQSTRADDEFEFKIGRLQVDNQTDSAPFVILAPDPEKGAKHQAGEGGVEDAGERPTVHVSAVRSRLYKDMGFYKYFAVGIRAMVLDLEETFVIRLLDAAQNVVDASTVSPSEEPADDLRVSGFRRMGFLSKNAPVAEKVYIELMQLHPILLTLSFQGTGAIMQRASTDGGGLSYNPMFASMKALGVVVTSIDKAPIELNALVLERPFATGAELVSSIRKHYKTQLVRQLYKLIGAFEFLGNPVGLVNNLGTGVHDFFYEPAQGITKSPGEFAKGVSKGSLSLLRNINYGVFNAASKMTGSLSKGLVQLTGDDAYVKKRQQAAAVRAAGEGKSTATSHGQEFASEVSEGLSGIFAKPMAGYAEGGATGFFKGLGSGLLGAVVKPTAGLSDLISRGAEAARDSAKGEIKVNTRVRPPRVVLGDGVLRVYDSRSAHGYDALRRLRGGEWKGERYIGYCVLEGGEAVVVTDHRVCVHGFGGGAEVWHCEVGDLQEMQVVGNSLKLKAPPAKGREAVRSMPMTDQEACDYLAETVQKAIMLHRTEVDRGVGVRGSEYML